MFCTFKNYSTKTARYEIIFGQSLLNNQVWVTIVSFRKLESLPMFTLNLGHNTLRRHRRYEVFARNSIRILTETNSSERQWNTYIEHSTKKIIYGFSLPNRNRKPKRETIPFIFYKWTRIPNGAQNVFSQNRVQLKMQ